MRPGWGESRHRRPSWRRSRRPSRLAEGVGRSTLFRQAVVAVALLAVAALVLPGEFPAALRFREELHRLVHERHDLQEVMARLNASPAIRNSLDRGFWQALFGARRSDRPRLLLPAEGEITVPYGWHIHPVHQDTRFHPGVDIAAPLGTPVHAAEAGKVTRIATDGDYGLMVEIDHGESLVTRYGHLDEAKVATGLEVTRGQEIGSVGQSGQAAGPHLHFEVLVNGKPEDPASWLGITGGS
ncbi:MAG: M23 family metallopeptidase [bacterium]|nr:M23 family metallopeptidase [bacterium]